MILTTWILAFLAMAILDVFWVACVRASAQGDAGIASMSAAAMHGLGAAATLLYVEDARYLSATILGTAVGTYGAVWWMKRRAKA